MTLDQSVRQTVREEVQRILAELLPKQDNEYLTTQQVAELTGLSVSFFEVGRSMSAPNQPPHMKVGRRVLYKRADVEAWLEDRRRG
ncbi:MAG: helix-turn-helix domain-containing protein [Hyphomonas sp.]|nr:helix-turn-helix domain-containing protein [Hyphomonas sp.]